MSEEILDKKGIIKAVIIATIVALIGIFVLGWYYHKLANKMADTEQTLEEQKETIEERAAQDVLKQFMLARISRNEDMAKSLLTEKAEEQVRLGEFSLVYEFSSYDILNIAKLDEDKYRFTVRINHKEIFFDMIEMVVLIKIPGRDDYFIDSVEIAG